jgi:hypothetical protein
MTDDAVVDLQEDWDFYQAIGIVAVQMGKPPAPPQSRWGDGRGRGRAEP